jgi:hypothetical protein
VIGWIRRRAGAAREDLDAAIAGRAVVARTQARFIGRRSAGLFQIRGTGELALTSDELIFVMWVPRRTLRVRRAEIEAIDTPRWFLGKSVGARLLRVRWRSGADVDEAAWHVPLLDDWLAALGG